MRTILSFAFALLISTSCNNQHEDKKPVATTSDGPVMYCSDEVIEKVRGEEMARSTDINRKEVVHHFAAEKDSCYFTATTASQSDKTKLDLAEVIACAYTDIDASADALEVSENEIDLGDGKKGKEFTFFVNAKKGERKFIQRIYNCDGNAIEQLSGARLLVTTKEKGNSIIQSISAHLPK